MMPMLPKNESEIYHHFFICLYLYLYLLHHHIITSKAQASQVQSSHAKTPPPPPPPAITTKPSTSPLLHSLILNPYHLLPTKYKMKFLLLILLLIPLLSNFALSKKKKTYPLGPACSETPKLCLYYCARANFRTPCKRKFPEVDVCYDLDTDFDDKITSYWTEMGCYRMGYWENKITMRFQVIVVQLSVKA
ncbi:hypothetical protein BZA77DRAFT_344451 [Pyronema omphalodes]|nr:hypothetical protein BZA77DRAFT_344451 [Pyronema omphalodes]